MHPRAQHVDLPVNEVRIAGAPSTQAEVKVGIGHAGQRAANVVFDREDVLPVRADKEKNHNHIVARSALIKATKF